MSDLLLKNAAGRKNYVGEHHAYPLKVQWFLYIPPSLTHLCSCILARMFKCLYNSDSLERQFWQTCIFQQLRWEEPKILHRFFPLTPSEQHDVIGVYFADAVLLIPVT